MLTSTQKPPYPLRGDKLDWARMIDDNNPLEEGSASPNSALPLSRVTIIKVTPTTPLRTFETSDTNLLTDQSAGLTVAHVDKNTKPPYALRGDKLDWARKIDDNNPLEEGSTSPNSALPLSRVITTKVKPATPLGTFVTRGTNLFTDILTSEVCLMLDWDDRKALAATSSAMYNLVYSHFPFYSREKESFLIYYRHNNKRRFKYLDHAHAKTCRSLIVAVNGPSLKYPT